MDVESLSSHRLTLDEANRGFELVQAHDSVRSPIVFQQPGSELLDAG